MTETADPKFAPPSILALHGLGGGRFELAPLLETLERAGCRVSAPVLPGHEVMGRVMPESRWEDWARTAEASFDALAGQGRPVVVVGFSTGGTLALLLATRRPLAGLILLAPFLAIRYLGLLPLAPSRYIRPLSRILPGLPRRSPPARDPGVGRNLRGVVRFETFSLRATASALDLIERVKPLVPGIATPTLILQGSRDTVVAPRGSSWLMNALGSTRKKLVWLPRSDHLLALDHDRDRVIAESLAFALNRGD